MSNDTRSHTVGAPPPSAHAPPYHGDVVHHHDHCAIRCQICGPDSSAYALGEAVVGAFVALATMIWWLVRHPTVALALTAIVFIGRMFVSG